MTMAKDIADSDAGALASPFRYKLLVRAIQRAWLPSVLASLATTPVFAAPTGGQVRAGSAAISHDAAHGLTTIKQSSQRTAIDWRSFDVGRHEQVQFKQPNAKATALNRIFDQKPSEIFGKVKANGRVVLMNPNGVFFRPGAEVNVGGLIAGAMRVGVDEFMRGRYQLQGEDGSAGRVVNQGTITAAAGGEVALVGKSVANEGVIVATAGRVTLVAGEQTTVDFDGDGLLRFKVDKAVVDNAEKLDDQVVNSGQIQADGGQILITASAAAEVFNRAINNKGLIKAGRIDKQGGQVRLVGMGPAASVLNTGQIDVSAASASDDGGHLTLRGAEVINRGALRADAVHGDGGLVDVRATDKTVFDAGSQVSATSVQGQGGRVHTTARQLELDFDAAIDASGGSGGGAVLVGGDQHGGNRALDNAERTFVSTDATIKADATARGTGGKVVVWADDTTHFHGKISAQGGPRGGDGGFVEVSGKAHLLYRGFADTRALRGATGTLLLDPATLLIIDAASGGEEDSLLPSIDFGDNNAGGTDTVSWGAIDAQAASANIVLEATGLVSVADVTGAAGGSITANDQVRLDLTSGSLTIRSTGGNVVFADSDDVIETKGGAITLSAANGTVSAAGLRTNLSGGNGAISIISNGNASFGDITTGGAVFTVNIASGNATQVAGKDIAGATALTKTGAGTLILSNTNSYAGATLVNGGQVLVTDDGGLGGNGSTTVASTAVLALDNVDIGNENLSLAGGTLRAAGNANIDGNIALTANSIIDVTGTELTLGGVISGGGLGIDKQGSGLLTLDDVNTYSGTTTISAGSIVAGVDDVFASSILNIAGASARFEMGTKDQTVIGLSGAGFVSNDAGGTNAVTLTINGGNGQTFNGSFFNNTADDISVSKIGVGSQTLAVGATTYAGTLTITDGTLSITTATSLGDATNGTVVSNSGTLNLNGLALASSETIDIAGSGIANVGALTATGSASLAASVVLSMTSAATIGGSGTLTLNTALNNGGSRALTKTGSGTLVLAANNTAAFTGATGTITVNAGVLKVTDVAGLGDTLGGTTVANDAQLEFALGASNTVAENLSIEGNGGASAALLHSSGNVLTLSGAVTLTNVGATDDATLSVSNGAGVLQLGTISDGAASLSLTKAGAGTLRLTTAANYNGVTHINGGVLAAGVADVLTNGTGLDVASGGVFNLAGFSQALAKLDGVAGAVVTNDAGSSNAVATLTITGGGGGYAGDITENGSDTLALVKSGTGTQSLSVVTGSYDGTAAVSGGTLSITTAASLGSASGATTVNGGTLALNAAALTGSETIHLSGSGNGGVGALTASGTANVGSGNSVVLDADASVGGAGTLEMDAVISASGGVRSLSKNGTGSLVLSANNSYSGATVISAGTVRAAAADVLDNSSGLNLTGASTTFNMAGFDQSLKKLDGVSGSVVRNDAGSTANTALLTISAGGGSFAGNLTENGSDQLSLSKSGSGTQILAGSANTYSGVTSVSGGTLQAGATDVLGVSHLNVSAATASFNLAGFDQTLGQLDGVAGAVVTNDAGNTANTATLTIAGGGNYAGELTENGTDTLSLTKSTAATLVLSVGTGSYDGATTVSGGTLSITTAASLGSTAAGTVVNGGTLNLNGLALASNEALSLAGSGAGGVGALTATGVASTGTGNLITLTADAEIGGAGVLTVNGVIAESGAARAVTKRGAGNLVLAGNNSYSGATTVAAGVLTAGAANVLDNSSGINLTAAAATLNLAGLAQTVTKLDGVAGAIVTNDAGNTATAATLTIAGGGGSYGGDLTQNGTDALSLTKSGSGTQSLAVVTGSYSGATTVSAGSLRITTGASLGTAAGQTSANGGTLDLNGLALATTETINLSGTGDGGVGALTGTGTSSLAATNTLTLTGNASLGGAGTLTLNGVIGETGGARNLTKTGAGTVILAASNNYSGVTTIAQGTLQAAAVNVLANSSGLSLNAATSFNLAGFDQAVAKLDGVAGSVVTNNSAAVADLATLTITAGGGSFAGNITESGGDALSLTKSGVGTQILAGSANTYTGPTTVSGGTLQAGVADLLAQSAGLNISVAGARFNLAGFNQSLVKLDGVAGAVLSNDAGSTNDVATLTITGGGGSYAGNITENATDTLSVTKSTSGTQVLAVGTGTYDGATAVTGGTLQVTTAASFGSSSGGIVINNAANAAATLDLATPGGTSIGDAVTLVGGNNPTLLHSTVGTTTLTGGITMTSAGTVNIAQASGTLAVTTVGISGAGTLTKSGPGTLQLGVATTLGGLNLSQGVLAIGLANALAASTNLTLATGTTFNLHGFNQTIASLSGVGTVTNDDAVGGSNAAATLTIAAGGGSFAGDITESADDVLSLTKSGSGTQILASTHSYTGVTTVSGGTLQAGAADILTSTAGLNLTALGATFNLAGFDQAVGAVTGVAGSVVTNNAGNVANLATLTITGTGGSFAGNITQTATDTLAFTKAGGGTQILSGTANTYAGATTVNGGTLQAGADNVLGATAGLVLSGAGASFNLAGFDQQVGKLDGGAGTVVTNNAGNTANAATLSITGGGGNFAGDITETGSDTLSLSKSGAGTQTLAVVTGSYDGSTTITGGILKIDTAASLGSTLGQTTASSGTLDLGALALASGETLNLIGSGNGGAGALTGTASVAASNSIVLTGTGAIGTTATFTIASVISGTGNLNKVGAGNLILSGANSFTGSAAVTQGSLTAGASNVLSTSAGLSVASGASFNLAGFAQAVKKLDGVAGAVVTNNAGGGGANATLSITAGGGSYAGNLTQNGLDDLSVTKSGSGVQSLSVVSGTYAGATSISGGTLSITTAASLGTASGATTVNGGTLDLNGLALASSEAINLNGTGTAGSGALTATGTASIANSNLLTLDADTSIGGAGTLTLTGILAESGGPRSLTKTGAGTLVLANTNNTYSGATLVAQGTLRAGAVDVLTNSSGLNLTAAGATFNLAGFDQAFSKLDGVAGSVVTNNAVAVAAVASLEINGGGGSFAGDLTETGGDTLSVRKSGTGTQVLSVGSGTYNGTTTITGGTLRAATTASLGSTSGATTVNGGTLDASFTGTSNEALILSGNGDGGAGALKGSNTGTFAGAVNLASATTINVDNGAAGTIDFTISGLISGGAGSSLRKAGPDTLVLAGNNSYAGATQIDAGTLKLGAANGIGAGSAVSIAAGATFDVNDHNATIGALGGGSGTLDLGLGSLAAADDLDLSGMTVVLAASGAANQTLRAGTDGSGTLTIDSLSKAASGNLTLVSPTLIDINGDVVVSAGNLTLSNSFNLAGDLLASGDVTLDAAGTLDGAASQTIAAQGGSLSTVGLTKTVGANGNLILSGGTAITATGAIDVQSPADDLVVAGDITTTSDLSATRNVIFQGPGISTFNGAGAQSITAASGAIRDTAGAVLATSGGADLFLNAGGAIGVSAANALGLALGGGSSLQATAGTDVFLTSAVDLRVNGLATGAGADTVDIRTTGATASLTMAGPYSNVASDDFTLVAARDLKIRASALDVATLDARFGQSGTAADFDIDDLISASTPGGFTITGGASNGDRIDAAGLSVELAFVASALNAGSIGNGLLVESYTAVESLVGGRGNDSLSGSDTYTVTGTDSGSAALLAGGWSAIENLIGSSAGDTFTFATGGALSGAIDGLAGVDTLSYAGRAAAVSIDLANLRATDLGAFANLETLIGGSGGADTLLGADNASNWTVSAANSGNIDDTTIGVVNSVEFNFAGFERLTGGAAADTFTIGAAGSVSGQIDGGGGDDSLTYASRASAVTVSLQSATVADGSSTFASFTGFETLVGSAAATDKLVGRNQQTDWNLTASGAGTIDDTPNGAPDGTVDLSFSAFENLQGGSAVDTFTAATGGALSFTQLAGGAGNDVFTIVANGGASTVLTTNIVGENDNDTVMFGVHETTPPANPSSNEFSRVLGSINLGSGVDTLDYSGSDLVLVNAVIDNDTGSGQSGTVRDASTDNAPNLSLLSGSYTDVDAVIGNGTQLQGADVETVWIITGNGRGRYGSTFATATTTFENFSIRGGNKRDVFIFKQEGPSNITPQLFSGIDGGDFIAGTATTHNFLLGSSGADQLLVTGANAVSITVTGGSGAATTDTFNINHLGDAGVSLTSGFSDSGADSVTVQAGRTWAGNVLTNGGNDTLTLGAGARIAGTLNLGAGRDTVDATAYTSAITARVTSANGSGMAASSSSFAGDFAGVETLNLGSGRDTVTLTVAPTGAANTINMGAAGGDTLASQVDASWVLSSNGAGVLRGLAGTASDQLAFSGVDNLTSSGRAVLSVPGAAASIAGTFTADQLSFAQGIVDVGNFGLRVAADVVSNNPLTLNASGNGNIAIRGSVTVNGAFNSNVANGSATYEDVITAGANQSYSGTTTVRGALTARDVVFDGAARIDGNITVRDANFAANADLRGPLVGRNFIFNGDTSLRADVSGQDLHFNGPLTIVDAVKLVSTSNVFDFNDEVSSDTQAVLSIVPTANTDLFIDLDDGPGHIAANRFGNFKGTVAIGGEFAAAPGGDVLNGSVLSAPADYLTVSRSLVTGGNLILIGSTVDLSKGNNISLGAGDAGAGTIVVMALGDELQAGNNGLPGGVTMGNIAAPTGSNTVTFTGGRVMLAATNEIENSQNMVMDLNGGDVLVAQGARATKTRIDFNVRSRAQASTTKVTDTGLINSLSALGAPPNLLQNTRASFPNPAAILTILQAVAFVDSSLFEEDLTLFGVIGDGIAKSLDQCEDAEGCAPSVTEEQLLALIEGLQQRIAALEKSVAAGDTATAKGATLLSQYRAELASYLDYQTQLHAYMAKQQQEEIGGDEFEDVFEAEEKIDPAAQAPSAGAGADSPAPAAAAPSLEEGSEDLFAPLEDAPAAPAPVAPEPPPSDIDEDFETLDEGPAPAARQAPPAVPARPANKDNAPAPADDFEELEELPDATLLNEVLSTSAVNQLAGLVRLDASGAVIWSGEVFLPTLHRRY